MSNPNKPCLRKQANRCHQPRCPRYSKHQEGNVAKNNKDEKDEDASTTRAPSKPVEIYRFPTPIKKPQLLSQCTPPTCPETSIPLPPTPQQEEAALSICPETSIPLPPTPQQEEDVLLAEFDEPMQEVPLPFLYRLYNLLISGGAQVHAYLPKSFFSWTASRTRRPLKRGIKPTPRQMLKSVIATPSWLLRFFISFVLSCFSVWLVRWWMRH